MVSLRQFVGAMLEQITRARVASDAASLRIADQYLQHDYLKGFPVPAMHVRDVDLELTFAVAPGFQQVSVFSDEDVRTNAVERLELVMKGVPSQADLKATFDQNPQLASRWIAGLASFRGKLNASLASGADRTALIQRLALVVENYFYEAARGEPKILSVLRRPFAAPQPDVGTRSAVHQYIHDEIEKIIDELDNTTAVAEAIVNAPDIEIMISKEELDRVPEAKLQKLKLTISANDRKWVVTTKDGEEIHTLTR